MPALETSSDLPPAFPDLHDGGNGIEEQWNTEEKIKQEHIEKGNRVQWLSACEKSHVPFG
jgi:hypothetical protein